jgi:hypothetical protein
VFGRTAGGRKHRCLDVRDSAGPSARSPDQDDHHNGRHSQERKQREPLPWTDLRGTQQQVIDAVEDPVDDSLEQRGLIVVYRICELAFSELPRLIAPDPHRNVGCD